MSAGRRRAPLWLPPGFRPRTPKRNVLVALFYLFLLATGLDLLRLLL